MSTKQQVLKIKKHSDTTQFLIKIISRNAGMKATWQGHAFIEVVTTSQVLRTTWPDSSNVTQFFWLGAAWVPKGPGRFAFQSAKRIRNGRNQINQSELTKTFNRSHPMAIAIEATMN